MIRRLPNFHLLIAALLSVAVLVHARAGPSGTPSSYICPPEDSNGVALGQRNEDTNPMFCSYPEFPGENPNDFYCTYNMITGVLIQDQDRGDCLPSAVLVSTKMRPRQNAHAPLPTRPKYVGGGVPEGAADRTYLDKRYATPAEPTQSVWGHFLERSQDF